MTNSKRFRLVILLAVIKIVCVIGNNPPEFITDVYPVTSHFPEGPATPAGATLHVFTVTDPDSSTFLMTYTYTPSGSEEMFTIADTGSGTYTVTLASGMTFDFETQSSYEIKAHAFDGVGTATGLITFEIDDDGEAPTLNPETPVQTFTIDESTLGTFIGNPNFTVVDLDLLETHTFLIASGVGTGEDFIDMDPVDGAIKLKRDYDREEVGTPPDVWVHVDIVDKFGLSATTTFSLIVNDVNDNTPSFNVTNLDITVSSSLTPGTTLGILGASDADAESPNNDVTVSVDTSLTGSYFEMDGFELKLKINSDIPDGTQGLTFNVYAVDGGSPAKTGTATVTVNVPVSTTTTTTTLIPPVGYSWIDDGNNVRILVIICLIAASFLGYCCMMCWRWHTFGQCLPKRCLDREDCSAYCERCCICCKKKTPDDERPPRGTSAISFSLVDDRGTPMNIDVEPFIIGKKGFPGVPAPAPVATTLQKKPKADLISGHGKWTNAY